MAEQTGSGGTGAQERLRTAAGGVALTFGGFLVAIVVVVLGIAVLGQVVDVRSRPILLYPAVTIFQGLGFGLAVAGYVVARERYGLVNVRLPTLRDLGWTVLGIVGLLGGLAAISRLYAYLDVSTAQNQIQEVGANNPEVMLYMIPLAFLIIGPGEELLFRGAIQGLFRESFDAVPAVLLSSALFAVAHVTALLGSSLQAKAATIVALFTLSIILGAIYERTDNLVVPSLVHGFYDAVVFLAIYAQAAGLAG